MTPQRDTLRSASALAVCLGLIAAGAAVLRTIDLALKPIHYDESVNGTLLLGLLETGTFHWANHGPILYYVNAVPMWLLGPSDTSLRLGTVAVGVLGVLLVALLRGALSRAGVVAAAALLAVQPLEVYFSRAAIPETHLATATLLLVGAGWIWLQGGGRRWAVLSALGLAFMLASKENAIISLGGIGLGAIASCWPSRWLRSASEDEPWPVLGRPELVDLLDRRGNDLVAAAIGFCVAMLALYTSFFTNAPGAGAIAGGHEFWFDSALSGAGHERPFRFFLGFAPAVWLAGGIACLELTVGLLRRERGTVFFGVWFLSVLGVYSALPYKTPWCFLQISLPLVLLAGHGFGRLWRARSGVPWRAALAGAGVLGLAMLGRQSWDWNFHRYDDTSLPHVYVQTERDYLDLLEWLEALAEKAGGRAGFSVATVDARHPLGWYLSTRGWSPESLRHDAALPDEQDPDAEERLAGLRAADVVVCNAQFARRLARALGPGYRVRTFPGWGSYRVTAFERARGRETRPSDGSRSRPGELPKPAS